MIFFIISKFLSSKKSKGRHALLGRFSRGYQARAALHKPTILFLGTWRVLTPSSSFVAGVVVVPPLSKRLLYRLSVSGTSCVPPQHVHLSTSTCLRWLPRRVQRGPRVCPAAPRRRAWYPEGPPSLVSPSTRWGRDLVALVALIALVACTHRICGIRARECGRTRLCSRLYAVARPWTRARERASLVHRSDKQGRGPDDR